MRQLLITNFLADQSIQMSPIIPAAVVAVTLQKIAALQRILTAMRTSATNAKGKVSSSNKKIKYNSENKQFSL